MAAEAGVDIVDCAINSMSSTTSQPSMNAIVTALQGQPRDTGLDPHQLRTCPITGRMCASATPSLKPISAIP